MMLNEAIETILDFYHVEVEGNCVVAHSHDVGPTTVEVWAAWNKLSQRVGRITTADKEQE